MSTVYCRQCRAPAPDGGRCPACGSTDPSGTKSTAVGALLVGAVIAAGVTGAFAYTLSAVWERWGRKFDTLPEEHSLHGCHNEVAWGIGVGVFVVSWALGVFRLWPRSASASAAR